MDRGNLAYQVKLAVEAPSESLPQDQETKKELLTALRKLTARIEDPVDSILNFLFQVRVSRAIFQTCIV